MAHAEGLAHSRCGPQRGTPRRRGTRAGTRRGSRGDPVLGALSVGLPAATCSRRVRRGLRLLATPPREPAYEAAARGVDEASPCLWGWGRRGYAEPDGSRLSRSVQRGALVHWAAADRRRSRAGARWTTQLSRRAGYRPKGSRSRRVTASIALVLDARCPFQA